MSSPPEGWAPRPVAAARPPDQRDAVLMAESARLPAPPRSCPPAPVPNLWGRP